MSERTIGDFGAGGQATLVGRPEEDKTPDVQDVDPERVLGTRGGWLVVKWPPGTHTYRELELRAADGRRLDIQAGTSDGHWSQLSLVEDGSRESIKRIEADVDDRDREDVVDEVERAAFEYATSNPSECRHGAERCPGRLGNRAGVLPCWQCWTSAPRDDIDRFHVAEDLRPSDGRDP